MRRHALYILLLASVIVSSCDNDPSSPIDPPAPTTEEQIIADCYVVRDALEAFAAENDGDYPCCLDEQSNAGRQFITYLPGGALLTNRYTGNATVPVIHDPQWPGEIGVIHYREPASSATGYRVVGRGRYGELLRLDDLSQISQQTLQRYDSTLAACDLVVAAAEAFKAVAGYYPASVGADALSSGDVMTDLLPGGWLLTNAFTGFRDSPVDGTAGWEGQIGYQPQDPDADGWWDSFIIDALGANWSTIAVRTRNSDEDFTARWAAGVLRNATEEFASQNGGEYPRDIDTDETPAGNTVLEIASCPWCVNAYTDASAFRNGLAASRGEVGYVPLEYNGIVVGYVINALGLFNVELERFEVLTN